MTFLRKGEVILIWKDKRLFCMMKTICDASIASTGEEDRRTGHQITKPTYILEYNKYMKRVTNLINIWQASVYSGKLKNGLLFE